MCNFGRVERSGPGRQSRSPTRSTRPQARYSFVAHLSRRRRCGIAKHVVVRPTARSKRPRWTVGKPVEVIRYRPADDDDGLGYWRELNQRWFDPTTLVNVEWDMEWSNRLVDDLIACPHAACTHAYMLYRPSTGGAPHYAQRVGLQPPAGGRWITANETWCDYTGIGFCKVERSARTRSLSETHWKFLDITVSAALNVRWHVHWPEVAHHHQC